MRKLLLVLIVGLSAFGCGQSVPVGSTKLETYGASKATATVVDFDRAENVSQTNSKTEMQKMIQSTEINHDALVTQDEVTSFKNLDNQTDDTDDDTEDEDGDEDDEDDGDDDEDTEDEDDEDYDDNGKHRRSKMSDDDDPGSYDSTYDDDVDK